MPNDVPMRKCFVGLFDILGFSNIVRNDKLENIWKAYNEIKSHSSLITGNLELVFKQKIINVETFSDTFLMYTSDLSNGEQKNIDKCFNAILGVCDALFHAANTNQFPIRGVITVGELIVNEGVHIGKPIVEAYEMEQKQDWIGCWISDDVIKRISDKLLKRHIDGNLIIKYKIPFKHGEIKECYVFNWVNLPFENDYDIGLLSVKQGHDWQAERKHRNTRDFIKFVMSSLHN